MQNLVKNIATRIMSIFWKDNILEFIFKSILKNYFVFTKNINLTTELYDWNVT